MTQTLRIAVASQNPVKVNAANEAFSLMFSHHQIECHGISVPSDVPEQPLNWRETREGALNRVNNLIKTTEADFYIAIEGGVDNFEDGPATFAYVVINDGKRQSVGRTAQLPLPNSVYQRLLDGEELGPVMDDIFGTNNIKQAGGAIGLLTNHNVTRQQQYEQSLLMAFGPFLKTALYC